MPTAWEGTPNDPNVKIGSRYVPLVFTPDAEPVAISVSYPLSTKKRAEERAYRDGAFLWPFLGSQRVGNKFTLVREGGWPADPKPIVDPTPPTITTFWTLLYDIDFAAQPNQTIFASGSGARSASPTIDGKTWEAFTNNNNGATPSAMMLVNSTGLVMVNGSAISPVSAGAVTGHRLTLPGAQVPGWDAVKKTAVLLHVTSVALSVITDAVMAASHTPGVNGSVRAFGKFSPANGGSAARWGSTYGNAPSTAVDDQASGAIDHVIGLARESATVALGSFLPWSGSMPNVEQMKGAAYISSATNVQPGTNFGVLCGAGSNHVYTVTVKRMQVLQQAA